MAIKIIQAFGRRGKQARSGGVSHVKVSPWNKTLGKRKGSGAFSRDFIGQSGEMGLHSPRLSPDWRRRYLKKARDPFVSPRRRLRPVRGPGRGVPGPFWPGSHRKLRGIMRLKRLDRACFFPLRSISRSSESERVSPVEPCSRNRVGFPTGPPHCSEAVVAEASRMVFS